ncbi:MAG: hypothetical protein RR446_09995 [Lachnospiraceae bacterium]|jgi:chaperone required for assembly of F1-ATPase|uniref:hypothetical protein n=1 Tax=Anaerosporobacter sp. TaxID=1872529 RepID=UPI00286FA6CE|nr:hypothetical protein [Anaerosporobacter sp.]
MSKVVEENVVKNMAFLIKMLEKEWEVSKESIKTVFISMDEVAKVKSDLSFMIQVNTGVLNSNNGMTFKECMMMNKENHTLLRITKKIITAIEKAEKDETEEFAITLDKEEAKLYKELFDKKN